MQMQKEWKQKIPRELFVRFCLWLQINCLKRVWVHKGTKFAGEFENLCKADEGIQIYSTMSETKAAFAERTKRSLKNILYRYMEDNGHKYIHKLTQFDATLNSRGNCSIDLIPKNVKISDFLSILYRKPLRKIGKPKFKVGDRVRISKYDLPFRKGHEPQFTKEVFEIVAISSKKPPTYTIKDEEDEIIRGKFYQKSLSKSINNGIVYNGAGFKCICATNSSQYTELFYTLFTRATESGWSMGGCNFRKNLPINVPKCYGGENYVFWQETFKIVRILLSGTWFLPFHYGFCWSHEHSHSRKIQSQRKLYQSQSVSKNAKFEKSPVKEGSDLAFFSTELGHSFWSNVGNEFGVMLRGKGRRKPEIAYEFVRINLSWYTPTLLSTISLATQKFHCCVAFLLFRSSKLGTF